MRCPRLTIRLLLRVLLVPLLALAACAPAGPRVIRYGEEGCGYCRMTITDRRFGGQALNARGWLDVFDSIECLADRVNAAPAGSTRRAWVADFQHPGTFIAADSARFVRLAAASSPMGAGIAAVSMTARIDLPTDGAPMTWAELLGTRREASGHAR